MRNDKDSKDVWLVVGHLLRDLFLGRWQQAAVWTRSLLRQLGTLIVCQDAGRKGGPR